MDKFLRFSDYDVFGYLSTGLAGLVMWDLVFGTHVILGAQWAVSDGVLIVGAAYIVGHLLATPATWLLERHVAFAMLGRPSTILVHDRPTEGFRGLLARTVLNDYYTPLHASVRTRLSTLSGDAEHGESLFQLAHPATMQSALVRARLETFLRLYGFCRNTAFVSLAGAAGLGFKGAALWASSGRAPATSSFELCLAALLVGGGLFHRYLKFLRLYAVTTLTTFAETLNRGVQVDAD